MKNTDRLFSYQVSVAIPMTLAEHAHLMYLSGEHYDRACRQISEPGQFLHGWESVIKFMGEGPYPQDSGVVYATGRELDILCKVCEQDRSYATDDHPANQELVQRLRNSLTLVYREQSRCNSREPETVLFHVSTGPWGQRRVAVTFEAWWDPTGEKAPSSIPDEVREKLREAIRSISPEGCEVRTEGEYMARMLKYVQDEWLEEHKRDQISRYGREIEP